MKLIPITPLHISGDAELTPSEYVYENQRLKVYPFDYILNHVFQEKNFERRHLLMGSLKQFFAVADTFPPLRDFFKANSWYIPPAYEISCKHGDVSSTIKLLPSNPEGSYLPGSEIKGALRFLFIFGVMAKVSQLRKALIERVSSFLKGLPRKPLLDKKEKEKLKRELEEIWNKFEIKIMRPENTSDSKLDLFRFIQVSDSESLPYHALEVEKVSVMNTRRNLTNYVVVIKPFEKIQVNLDFLKNSLSNLKSCDRFYRWSYRDFLSLSFIREASYNFFKAWLSFEREHVRRLQYLSEREKDTYFKSLQNLEKTVDKFYEATGRAIILRLGRFQGFMSLTLSLLIYRENSSLFEELFKFVAPRVSVQINKTRSVVAGSLAPLGWSVLFLD